MAFSSRLIENLGRLITGQELIPGNSIIPGVGLSSGDFQAVTNPLKFASQFFPGISDAQAVISSGSSSSGASDSSGDDTLPQYLDGLFSSVGAENLLNREYNSAEALKQRAWASNENAIQRDWATHMSNTAYQRAVVDLKAAGLNPILAYTQGGASSPSASMASGSSSSYQTGGGDTISNLLNSFANVASAVADFLPSVKKILHYR